MPTRHDSTPFPRQGNFSVSGATPTSPALFSFVVLFKCSSSLGYGGCVSSGRLPHTFSGKTTMCEAPPSRYFFTANEFAGFPPSPKRIKATQKSTRNTFTHRRTRRPRGTSCYADVPVCACVFACTEHGSSVCHGGARRQDWFTVQQGGGLTQSGGRGGANRYAVGEWTGGVCVGVAPCVPRQQTATVEHREGAAHVVPEASQGTRQGGGRGRRRELHRATQPHRPEPADRGSGGGGCGEGGSH